MRLLVLSAVLMISACADPARNLYEGIRQHQDAHRTPQERATQPSTDYDTYRKEMERSDR